MPKYVAKKNLTVAHSKKEGEKPTHKPVKAGEVFECSDDYYAEHLEPHGHAEPHSAKSEGKSDEKGSEGGKGKDKK